MYNLLIMYKIMLLAAFVVIAEAAPQRSFLSSECLLSFDGCKKSLKTFQENLNKVRTKDDMEQLCNQKEFEVACVENHVSSCLPVTVRKILDDTIEAYKQFTEEICVEGPTQDRYLQYSSCYEKVSKGQCRPSFEERKRQIMNEQKNDEDRLRETCWALKDFMQCKITDITELCGSDAADLERYKMDHVSSPFLRFACDRFTDEDSENEI